MADQGADGHNRCLVHYPLSLGPRVRHSGSLADRLAVAAVRPAQDGVPCDRADRREIVNGEFDKAYALDKSIRIADEKLPPEGVAIKVDEFDRDGVVYEKDGVKVIAFEVDHGAAIKPAYGYRIEYNGHAVTISGDTRYNENVIKYGTGADVLIHEVGMARPELMSNIFVQRIIDHHTTPKDVGRVFAQAKPKLGVYTHIVMLSSEKIPEPTIDDLVAETRQTYSGPLEVGDDLTSFEIGDTVTVTKFKP